MTLKKVEDEANKYEEIFKKIGKRRKTDIFQGMEVMIFRLTGLLGN